MNDQLSHKQVLFKKVTYSLSLLTDRISSPSNLGGIFRSSDAFGIDKLYLFSENINLSTPRFLKASRNTERAVNYQCIKDPLIVINDHKDEGYLILGLEITRKSIPIQDLTLPPNQKVLLVAGSEQYGVSPEILALVDHTIHIEMMGQNSSMNVTNALSVAFYSITQKLAYE
ncbi:hypothetical protein GCM10009117_01180 [Gangjinia marincola]|uniref:tRNA/rRNA methyltransferase SpoU type domain-containing protein n=2 Tax=Gangjinia marincola TaxID=578463 RepID=A0ABP3XNS9_9FLAO